MTALRGAVFVVLAIGLHATPASSQDEMITRFNRARGLVMATAAEEALDSLRAIRNDLSSSGNIPMRMDVLTYLAKVQLSLGNATAASASFQDMVRLDPFHSIDSTAHNPDVINLYRGARAGVSVVAVVAPADTTIKPDVGSLDLRLAVAKAGGVSFRFVRLSDAARVHLVQVGVGANTKVLVPLLLADSTALPPGEYRLDVLFRAPDGGSDSTALRLGVERLPVDTTAHLPEVDPLAFRSETRKGGFVITSVIQGVVVGVAAGAIPAFVANKEIDDPRVPIESVGLGVGIGLAGVLGAVIGRSDVTVQENVDYNIELVNARTRENALIQAENAKLRDLAPLRIVVRSP